MRRLLFLAIVAAFSVSVGQTPAKEDQLLALINKVQAQQKEIAENQEKIDAKLAQIRENLRVARIFGSRSN
jgi:hypothetical protein